MFRPKHVLSLFLLIVLIGLVPLYAELTKTEIKALKSKRIIPVKVVVDYTFCYHNMPWKWTARKIISEAFYEFRPLGIDPKVLEIIKIEKIHAVSTPHKISHILADLLYITQEVDPPEGGIVVWLTSRYYGHTSKFYEGCAIFPSRYCMATDNRQFEDSRHYGTTNIEQIFELRLHRKKFGKMLAHEIGHLFGAQHADNSKSIMAEEMNSHIAKFDKISTQKILQNKWLAFSSLAIKPRHFQQPEQK